MCTFTLLYKIENIVEGLLFPPSSAFLRTYKIFTKIIFLFTSTSSNLNFLQSVTGERELFGSRLARAD